MTLPMAVRFPCCNHGHEFTLPQLGAFMLWTEARFGVVVSDT